MAKKKRDAKKKIDAKNEILEKIDDQSALSVYGITIPISPKELTLIKLKETLQETTETLEQIKNIPEIYNEKNTLQINEKNTLLIEDIKNNIDKIKQEIDNENTSKRNMFVNNILEFKVNYFRI